MSFLDNFSWAFQDIVLVSKIYEEWKYWEKKESSTTRTSFRWVIQKIKYFTDLFLWDDNKIRLTSNDFELRCNVDINPKKWDDIISHNNTYFVIYTEKVIIKWKHDHNICVIRLIN